MHTSKTGGLIRVAAVSGAIMAGGRPEHIEGVERFAANIGIAFQIVDDILDVEGGSAETGKSCGKDAAALKPTYPALVGLERSRVLAASHVAAAEQALAESALPDYYLTDLARWGAGATLLAEPQDALRVAPTRRAARRSAGYARRARPAGRRR